MEQGGKNAPRKEPVWGVRDATGRKGVPLGGTEVLHGVLESWRGEEICMRAGGGTWERVVTHQISTFIKERKKKKTTGARFLIVRKGGTNT